MKHLRFASLGVFGLVFCHCQIADNHVFQLFSLDFAMVGFVLEFWKGWNVKMIHELAQLGILFRFIV